MLTLSGLKKFYFLPNFHDMRCKAPRVAEIVRNMRIMPTICMRSPS